MHRREPRAKTEADESVFTLAPPMASLALTMAGVTSMMRVRSSAPSDPTPTSYVANTRLGQRSKISLLAEW